MFPHHSVAGVRRPLFAAVAAIERASIRATEEICPLWILEPSRFGKFLVEWRILKALFAGVSPAPKHGPQNAVFTMAPVSIRVCQCSVLRKFHINRCTCRINTQCECVCSDACTFQNICGCTDVLKSTTGTSCDNSLFHIQFSIAYLIFQCEINLLHPG